MNTQTPFDSFTKIGAELSITAQEYIISILKNNNHKIILLDLSLIDSNDDSTYFDQLYKLPGINYISKHGYHKEYGIAEISLNDNDNIVMKAIDKGEDGDSDTFYVHHLELYDLLVLTDLINEKYGDNNNNNNNTMEVTDITTEKIAELAHDVWAEWMKYMFSKCHEETSDSELHSKDLFNRTGNLIIPKELVDRWKRQMNTPYQELPENEKKSDQLLAERYINKIRE